MKTRIIESFQGWAGIAQSLNENVKEAKAFMIKRYAEASGKSPNEVTPEEQQKIFSNEDYRQAVQLAQSTPGYTGFVVKFRIGHRVTLDKIKKMLETIEKNRQFLGELSLPLIDFPNQDRVNGVPPFEALEDEFAKIEARRKSKWIIDELPGDLRRSVRTLAKEDIQRLFNAATLIDKFDTENPPSGQDQKSVKQRLLVKARAFASTDPTGFITYTENYIKGYLNADVSKIIEKVEALEPEGSIIYADDQYLMISCRTERAQKELCAIANWCINRGSFNSKQYGGGAVQINTFNFSLPPTDPLYLLGTTISYDGKVTYSHDINDKSVFFTSDPAQHFKKFEYPEAMISTLIKIFPIEAMIKKVVTELNLDKKKPIEVLLSVIKSSYTINPDEDKDASRVVLNILMERIAPAVTEEELIDLYSKYGILSTFSAKLFNMLLPKISPEKKTQVFNTVKTIFDEIKKIASTGAFKYPQLLNAIKAEGAIYQILGMGVNEAYDTTFAEPITKPTIKPPVTKPSTTPRPGPIPTKKPSKNPEPSATAEEVVDRLLAELKKMKTTVKEFLK